MSYTKSSDSLINIQSEFIIMIDCNFFNPPKSINMYPKIFRLYECKQMCSDLLEDGVEVEIIWIPAHVRLEGNEIVEERTRHTALNGAVFKRPLPLVDFQGLVKSVLLIEWQGKWDAADTGRFAHSVLPKVSFRPWFDGYR
jgi:hypothetical protein